MFEGGGVGGGVQKGGVLVVASEGALPQGVAGLGLCGVLFGVLHTP
jgi:hypothetical protein